MLRSFITPVLFRRFYSTNSLTTVKEALSKKPVNQKILVRGRVQALRKYKELCFIDLIDGTCFDRLQIVINAQDKEIPSCGNSIKVHGLVVKSSHKGQEIELVADSWETVGTLPENHPLKDNHNYTPEYIRQFPHLRPRTKRFWCISSIRNHASMAVHKFFQEGEFCFYHTPVLTQNDCEGKREIFTAEFKELPPEMLPKNEQSSTKNTQTVSDDDEENVSDEDEESGNSEYYFGAPTFLTGSGQFHLEALISGLPKVYNFGPAFRTEASRSRLHASEFQMIEAEIAYTESIDDLMNVVEKCLKQVTKSVMDRCPKELNFITKDIKKHERYLENYVSKPFIKIPYKDAISILQKNNSSFRKPIEYGDDIATAHKQFLVKHCNNVPVFICTFPSSLTPAYMKIGENNKAYCFDLFAAYGGEICGGGLREDDPEKLMKTGSFNHSSLEWYVDLRREEYLPHGGFGIGFDRFLLSILGISNLKDVIPFPRRKRECKC
ncbi:probable asparagine--tRNA ligase, mitochondrial [Caerostris darwini]|uniref:asparagine--tRNA ligase n=1 Tax=Caerostris darwini TaxID=1538125 RepID=A0AAV4US97_9ARAC|nr:probable asparagine--tRNA ligase, mitochondrial [Caerostris darwini]